MLILTVALALMAQDCRSALPGPSAPCSFVEGVVREPGEGSTYYTLERDDDGPDISLFASFGYVHASGERMTLASSAGRRARLCQTHTGMPVAVLSGLPPSDYAMAMAVAEFVAPAAPGVSARPPAGHARLVREGLADRRWATREAAHRALVAAGADAIPELSAGLASRDPEVRLRCGLALDEIRLGSPPPKPKPPLVPPR